MSQHDTTSINSQDNTSIDINSNKGTEIISYGNNIDHTILSQDTSFLGGNNNLRILYITLAIIVGILLLWIVIVFFTKEDPLKILAEMTDVTKQLTPVSDAFLSSSVITPSPQLI